MPADGIRAQVCVALGQYPAEPQSALTTHDLPSYLLGKVDPGKSSHLLFESVQYKPSAQPSAGPAHESSSLPGFAQTPQLPDPLHSRLSH